MPPTRARLAPVEVTAIEYTGPETDEQIRALAEASTTHRPALLPATHGETARVYLADQRSWVTLLEGHTVAVLPSGALIILSPAALSSIRHTDTSDYDHVVFAAEDEDGEGANTILTAGQPATETLRINGTNLAECYVSEDGDGYPTLHHVPPGGEEGDEGHLVTFVEAGDNLLNLVWAVTDHVCGADDDDDDDDE
jgi:hypothetical protein